MKKEASFYKRSGDKVECELCPHNCSLKPGQIGICNIRYNDDGVLYTLNYANVSALALDPIEKKPLYHFYPGKTILSAGTYGCNLACSYCQNYGIAQELGQGRTISPAEMVKISLDAKAEDSVGLAFTYNEPTIWYEYIWDTAYMLKEAGMQVVLVTNGYIGKEPLQKLLPFVDAMNIDLKSFSSEFYRKNCKAKLEPVKATIENALDKVHLEITTLIITDENDNPAEIKELVKYLATLNPDLPLHISRYHPAYKLQNPPTSTRTMEMAYNIAKEHLNFVYVGNMPFANDTYCTSCGANLINRNNYKIKLRAYKAGKCTNCGLDVDYIIS